MKSARIAPLGLLLLGTVLLGAAALTDALLPTEPVREAPSALVEANARSVALACPTGIIDPFDTTRRASAGIWSSTGLDAAHDAPETLTARAGEGQTLTIPSAMILSGQGGGDLLGLTTTGCAVPSLDQWLAIGPTTVGSDAVLLLSNPAPTPSQVTIEGYGALGPLGEAGQVVTVPANSSVALLPAGWFADEERLVLRVRADGAGVAAFAQVSKMNGEIPRGTTWIPSTTPLKSTTILGVGGEDSSSLLVAVPGEDPAALSITLLTPSGPRALEGGDVRIDAKGVLSIPLTGASKEAIGIRIDSDQAIVATAIQTRIAGPWPGSQEQREVISSLVPASAVMTADLPGLGALRPLVDGQLLAEPLRATSIATPSGSGTVAASLLVANPALEGGAPVAVSLGSERLELAAGASAQIRLDEDDARLRADGPVRAALLISVETPSGALHSAWPIGTAGLVAREAEVRLGP